MDEQNVTGTCFCFLIRFSCIVSCQQKIPPVSHPHDHGFETPKQADDL